MSDIRLITLNNYVRPKIEENKGRNWVQNGKDNSFYQYIIDRNNGSVTNSAVNKAYTDLIYGKGIHARDAAQKASQWANFVSIISPKELKKIVADFQVFGEASMQVIKTKDRKKVSGIYHLPNQLVIPSIENEDGEIESYWYSKNWKKLAQNPPEEFPAFGTTRDEIEIYVIKPFTVGCNYFGIPDYMAGLQYAEIEEEISNFFINAIHNGLSVGYIINVPDGVTMSPEEKADFERKIKAKLTRSPNAQSFVINFGPAASPITVEALPVNEQMHKQWESLTKESRQQILTAHRVVSPMLFGIYDGTGFSNNADELETAEAQTIKRVVQPKQNHIIDAIKDIVAFNGITLDLYFKPLSEPAANMQMSSHDEKKNLDTTVADELIKLGEDEPGPEWELIETKIVEDYEAEMQFTSTGTAIPNAKSVLDGKQFMSRFRYVGQLSSNSRSFCQKMITANKLYRLEDINKMSATVVNEGWGPRGSDTYDIFLYKGGGNCKHAWQRESYRLKTDVKSPLAKEVTPAEARKAGEILPTVDRKAYTKPEDMPYNGFLPPASKL